MQPSKSSSKQRQRSAAPSLSRAPRADTRDRRKCGRGWCTCRGTLFAGSNDTSRAYDAQKAEYVDMIQAGIIDPTKVMRLALQNAASVANLFITTEVLVVEEVEKLRGGSTGAQKNSPGRSCCPNGSLIAAAMTSALVFRQFNPVRPAKPLDLQAPRLRRCCPTWRVRIAQALGSPPYERCIGWLGSWKRPTAGGRRAT